MTLTGAIGNVPESEPYHETEGEQHVDEKDWRPEP